MATKWYQKSFRRNLIDMHIEDWNDEFLSQFDPDAYFECLKMAHIQSPMIYIQAHTGLCFWDTKSGRTHKAFVGNNKIKRLFDLCHDEGMDVIAYYSLIFNNWAYDAHPQWRTIDVEGCPSREAVTKGVFSGRYGLVCPNQAGYREFIKAQYTEFCNEYQFEGIFLDMTFWPNVCYCDACCARYRSEVGRELPRVVDWNDPNWLLFQQARQRWIGEFAAFASKELKKLRPEVDIEHQYSGIASNWMRGNDELNGIASDYAGGDLYGGHLEESYICKLYYEVTANQPFEYMTSRCDPNLNDHTTTKSLHDLKLHNYLTLAHHGAFLLIDAIDPIGTFNPAVYQRASQVFEESMPYEPYLTGQLQAEAALVLCYDSKYDIHAHPEAPTKASQNHPQLIAQLGAACILNVARIPYTVLPSNRLEKLQDKRLTIISDAPQLRETERAALINFVQTGGALYLSGSTDPKLVEVLLGLKFIGFTPETVTYLAPTEEGQSCFGELYSPKYPMAFQGCQAIMDNPLEQTVLATTVLPYTIPSDFSKFTSIHSNPPGVLTKFPAIVHGQYGLGQVMWVSAAIERNAQQAHQTVVMNLLERLMQPSLLVSDAPTCVEMTLFYDPVAKSYTFHCVNIQEHAQLPIPPFEVRLKLKHTIDRILHLPDRKPTHFQYEQEWIVFHVDHLDIFHMLLLEIQ